MESNTENTLGEILLKKRVSTSIRFDILLSSFIAGLMIPTLPDGLRGLVLLLCAFGLSLTGLVRWLGVTGRFANQKVILNRTYRPLELLTIVGIFHLINTVIGYSLAELFPLIARPILTSLGAVTVTIIGIIGIEFIQRNYLLWWGAVFFVKASESKQLKQDADKPIKQLHEALANLWGSISFFLLQDSIPDIEGPGLSDLRQFVEDASEEAGEGDVTSLMFVLVVLLALLIIPLFGIIAWILSWILGPAAHIFAVLIGVWSLQHMINFYYMTNGAVRFNTWLKTNKEVFLIRIFYTGTIYWVFFII
jgi:hypothetical protein